MNFVVLLSGGAGTRLGGNIPKQYLEIAGKPMVVYAIDALLRSEMVDGLCIVANAEWQEFILDVIKRSSRLSDVFSEKFMSFASPGENRQLSILSGMESIKNWMRENDVPNNPRAGAGDTVLIHDAARPILPLSQLNKLYDGIVGHDGVMPVLPMKDTIYFCDDCHISERIDRSRVFAGQAPELFDFDKYYEANKKLSREEILEINGSSEVAVMAGMDVAVIEGDERNFKVTTAEDLVRMTRAIEAGDDFS